MTEKLYTSGQVDFFGKDNGYRYKFSCITTGELIKLLQQYPEDTPVFWLDRDDELYTPKVETEKIYPGVNDIAGKGDAESAKGFYVYDEDENSDLNPAIVFDAVVISC